MKENYWLSGTPTDTTDSFGRRQREPSKQSDKRAQLEQVDVEDRESRQVSEKRHSAPVGGRQQRRRWLSPLRFASRRLSGGDAPRSRPKVGSESGSTDHSDNAMDRKEEEKRAIGDQECLSSQRRSEQQLQQQREQHQEPVFEARPASPEVAPRPADGQHERPPMETAARQSKEPKASHQLGRKRRMAKKQSEQELNLSFCGCGFLGIYHVGVASCFLEYAPQLSMHKISGSSAGALVAAAHICGNLSLAYATTDFLRVAIEATSRALGPFHPNFDIQALVREALERGLPEDVHLRASRKLHISLTRVYDGENVIVNEFSSKEEVIQALLCSCFIPFWSGLTAPKFRDVAYVDGGFSNNLLTLDKRTVTVSPFAGESDICPQDDTFNLLQINLSNTSFSLSPNNLYRLSHALLPPPPEVLSDLCEQGFADGIRYLQRMKLISCTKCLEIRSSLLVTTNGQDMEEAFSNCSQAAVADGELMIISSADNAETKIRLEQQEQKTIEIDENSQRRNSIVSTASLSFRHQQLPQAQQMIEEDDNCDQCALMRQRASVNNLSLPDLVNASIRDACEAVNKSLSKWIYSHRPIKYLAYLAIPYYLPVDLSLALMSRFWHRLPAFRNELADCLANLSQFLHDILRRAQTRSTSAILMAPLGHWEEEEAIKYERELIRLKRCSSTASPALSSSATTTTATTSESAFSVKFTNEGVCVSKFHHNSRNSLSSNQLHSLEDTFDSIVDVTSNQEARIFAYYFRDAKNRLQVTEIFDHQRAAELSAPPSAPTSTCPTATTTSTIASRQH